MIYSLTEMKIYFIKLFLTNMYIYSIFNIKSCTYARSKYTITITYLYIVLCFRIVIKKHIGPDKRFNRTAVPMLVRDWRL